jgi:hypothetical protein
MSCSDGVCKPQVYAALCPEQIVLDEKHLYFVQDVRVVALERSSGQLRTLVKRKRKPRELSINEVYIHWMEGDQQAEIWRVPKTGKAGTPAELLAKRQGGATSLASDESGVYWAADVLNQSSAGAIRRAIYGLFLAAPAAAEPQGEN